MSELTLTIKIEAPALAAAIVRLADALSPGRTDAVETATTAPAPAAPVAPIAQPPAPAAPAVPTAPTSVPIAPTAAPAAGTAPVAPTAATPTAPTSPTPGYTLEQLSRAGAELISKDPGKVPQLTALLQQYGVQAITMLPPEQYGAFATALRGLGASL